MKTGVEKIAHFGKVPVTLTVWKDIVMDQNLVIVTTVPIMPNSMNATTAYA